MIFRSFDTDRYFDTERKKWYYVESRFIVEEWLKKMNIEHQWIWREQIILPHLEIYDNNDIEFFRLTWSGKGDMI